MLPAQLTLLMMKIKSRQEKTTQEKSLLDISLLTGKVSQSAAYIARKGVWQGCLHQS
jgi:hypothetical protein